MADRKISDLTALTTPASGDFLPIVDISEAAAATKNKRITIEELMRGMPDGTAAAPGIAFENDPNTGIYSPGADTLAFVEGGVEAMRITSAGLVGIGTTSPSTTLDCKGNITLGSQNASAANVQPTTGSGTNIAGTHLTLRAGIPTGSGVSGQVQIFPSTSSATGGTSPAANASKGLYLRQQITSWDSNPALFMLNAVFGASASEGNRSGLVNDGAVVTIDGASNGSQSALEIVGSSNASFGTQGFIRFFGSSSKNPYVTIGASTPGTSYTSGNFFINTYNSGTEGTVATFTNTGNVGIGTTSPGNLLHVSGTGTVCQLASSNNNNLINLKGNGATNGVWLGTTSSDDFLISSGASISERARIDSSGRLLVGTSTANTSGAKLQTSDGLTFPTTQVASADANTLDDYEEGTWTATIVGTTTAGTATYAAQTGNYTKVGRAVSIILYIAWSGHTGTGNMNLHGLPFTSASGNNSAGVTIGYLNNLALTANSVFSPIIDAGQTKVDFYQSPVGGGAIATVPIDAVAAFALSCTYFV